MSIGAENRFLSEVIGRSKKRSAIVKYPDRKLVAGDRERNEELKNYGLSRMFLHAASIGVLRPGTHEPLHVSAPLSAELHAVLDALLKAPGSRRGARRR